jgi:hypothetical protein
MIIHLVSRLCNNFLSNLVNYNMYADLVNPDFSVLSCVHNSVLV